jgi:hypothetical protein
VHGKAAQGARGTFADVPAPRLVLRGDRDSNVRGEDSVTDYWSRPSGYGQSTDYHVMPNGQIDGPEERRTSNLYRTRIDQD